MTDFDAVVTGLREAVPFVRTLGLEYLEVSADRAVLRLPDEPAHHNHIGGPHAGAMFTLAESASGAIVLAAFMGEMSRATPLPTHAEITFAKRAHGVVLAEATLGRPAADVVAELDKGERPEFPVHVAIRTEDGTETGAMTITWTLRPHR